MLHDAALVILVHNLVYLPMILKGLWSGLPREWWSLPLQTFSGGVGWKEC